MCCSTFLECHQIRKQCCFRPQVCHSAARTPSPWSIVHRRSVSRAPLSCLRGSPLMTLVQCLLSAASALLQNWISASIRPPLDPFCHADWFRCCRERVRCEVRGWCRGTRLKEKNIFVDVSFNVCLFFFFLRGNRGNLLIHYVATRESWRCQ